MARVEGRLQVIATPIGNLADLSERAREALAGADVIAAEDTRHTAALLQANGIARPMISLVTAAFNFAELARAPCTRGRSSGIANRGGFPWMGE